AEVGSSPFWAQLLSELRGLPRVRCVVCLGIGNFSHHPAPRYQLALAFLIRETLSAGNCDSPGSTAEEAVALSLYDPVLQPAEIEYARSCGCQVPTSNAMGFVQALAGEGESSLFFMPHCAKQLYSNVLAANYSVERLSALAVLGNSFQSYMQVEGTR
ncbi:MAG: hypothetical protein SGPRY_008064, partial [Prymnesium sp.]